MYLASFLTATAATFATLTTALPTDVTGDATLVSRQTNGPNGLSLPSGFTIPSPGPVAPGGCFIGRVLMASDPNLIGNFIGAPQWGNSFLTPDPLLGTPLMIDPDNRLRLAWFPLSVGWRQALLPFPDGWLAFRDKGPLQNLDNLLTCDASNGTLQCQSEPGDVMLHNGCELWVGKPGLPALQYLKPVTIQTYPIPCLPPANGFHF